MHRIRSVFQFTLCGFYVYMQQPAKVKCKVIQKLVFLHLSATDLLPPNGSVRELGKGYLPDKHYHAATCVRGATVPRVGNDRSMSIWRENTKVYIVVQYLNSVAAKSCGGPAARVQTADCGTVSTLYA